MTAFDGLVFGAAGASIVWALLLAGLLAHCVRLQRRVRHARALLAEADQTVRELMAQSRRMAELVIAVAPDPDVVSPLRRRAS